MDGTPGSARRWSINSTSIWSIIGAPFTGRYREASVVHDYYCDTKSERWQDTHRVFYDGMRANGVDAATAKLM